MGKLMRLDGKTAIVTGGANGIGQATVRRFVEEGATVRIVDLDDRSAEDLADELGDAASAAPADVTDYSQVQALVEAAMRDWGRVDVLVNNAGVELNKAYDEMTEAEWDRVITTNLKAPWLMCKATVPHMVAAGSGSVVNTSSLNGLVGFPLSVAYGSAKGGLVIQTKDLAIELAKTGVRVNVVCPGVIDTPMMRRWTSQMPDQNEAIEMLEGVMPIGRLGHVDEVASAILFLASDEASLATGCVLSIDGGFTAQ